MFPELKRNKYAMTSEESIKLLNRSNHGVLGMISENGYPYTVFVNYVVINSKIYIHCAQEGHKLDCIRNNEHVSFATAEKVQLIPQNFTTHYTSIICFGRARLINASRDILQAFIDKFSPDFQEKGQQVIEADFKETQLIEIEIDHISGKNTHKI